MLKRNPSVPFGTFYHPPVQLPEFMVAKGCANSRNLLVMNALFGLVDFNKTERVGEYDFVAGTTVVVSNPGLGGRCFMSERSVRTAVAEMEGKMFSRKKVGKCHLYHLFPYDEAIAYLKENPDHPMTLTARPIGSATKLAAIQAQVAEFADEDDNTAESANTTRQNLHDNTANSADNQELLPESSESPGFPSTVPSDVDAEEKTGGDLNTEKQEEANQEEEKNSLREEPDDVVPNQHLGEVNDLVEKLTQSKNMNVSETDATIEDFITLFFPQPNVVSSLKHAESAAALKGHLEGRLSAAGIQMPPLLFFKKCLEDMDNRIADGKIDERPVSLNYFMKHSVGKDIVEYCLDLAGSENKASESLRKTDERLDRIKEGKKTGDREIPAESLAELRKMFGEGFGR